SVHLRVLPSFPTRRSSDLYSVDGYSAHSPKNDLGVITPTAAISSIPYTPEYSMEFIRHLYNDLGDRLWGKYGFYDAFSETDNWRSEEHTSELQSRENLVCR